MSLPKLSVSNPVFANLLMLIIIVFGTIAWFVLPRALSPDITVQSATVTTIYPGASPVEVEKLVTVPIEEAIEDNVNKIDLMLSTSSEGISTISIQFEEISDRDFSKQMQNMRSAVERVNDLPNEILNEPEVVEFDMESTFPVLTLVVGGTISEPQMKSIAENLRDDILDIEGVGSVRLAGAREREIWIEVDPAKLRAYQLPITEVINALRNHNLNLPAGTMEVGTSEYLVRTLGEFRSIDEIQDTIIRARGTGTSLRLSDIATVSDTYEKPRTLSRIHGTPSISLTIQRKTESNTIKLVEQIRGVVEKYKVNAPEEARISAVNDYSVILKERFGILETNAFFGLFLVVILLFVFLGFRNALFAALGIPVAFMATFLFMHLTGIVLSGVALFGLILVVGIVVDDAIVVIENIYRHIQRGRSPREAAVVGAEQVGTPVLAASLTTVAAFGPLMFMTGISGQFMRVVPIVAILVLAASLLEVFMILPAHVSEWGKVSNNNARRNRWFNPIKQRYVAVLNYILRWRYAVVFGVLATGVVVCAAAFLALDKELFPGEDFPQFYLKAEMPPSFGMNETSEVISQLEQVAASIPPEERVAIVSNLGLHTPTSGILAGTTFRSNVGEVLVELVPKNQRKRSVDDIVDQLRPQIAKVSGIEKLTIDKLQGGPPSGADVDVKIKGQDFRELKRISEMLQSELRQMDGVYEIQDDFLVGKSELRVHVKEEKAHQYGLNVFQIAYNVRNAIEGNTTTTYRDADEAVDVIVKYSDGALKAVSDLGELLIATPTGAIIPLRDVAEVREERGYVEVRRFDGERAITVNASVDSDRTTTVEVNQALIATFAGIESMFPGYRLDFRGEFDQIQESFADLVQLFTIGVFLIYVILATQFKSFLQPVIILLAVPFGIIGAMIGLLAVGATLSMIAMFGIVALAGIVVNDSIVLIDFINRYRRNGSGRWRAILRGAGVRLRPILLTTITTVCGLIPMAVGLGGKSPIWMPLASTIIFGLTFATLLTLFVMPALYAITTDINALFARKPTPARSPAMEDLPVGAEISADD